MHRYSLFIVSNPMRQDAHDFHRIAALVREMAPEIDAEAFSWHRRARGPRWRSLLRPTLTLEINPGSRFRPLRGPVLRCPPGDKIAEYRLLDAAGLPVPPWQEIVPGTSLDPEEWGPYVVEKPSRGMRGAFVRFRKAGRVRYQPPESYPEDHPGRRGPMLAQRYIHTGEKPKVVRVLTCCGRAVAAYQQHNLAAAPRDKLHPQHGAVSENIVAAAKGNAISLCNEPDILALAEACHAAIPEPPMIGSDIMRDAETGKLWVAEVNRGDCWSLSDLAGRKIQAEFGLDLYAQLGALRRAAEGMIDYTRRFAR